MNKKILVYGSLKQNHYNFNRCGPQKYIKTFQLDGYDLYSFGAYPGIIPGKGKLTVELHEVNEDTLRHIRGMELGAGYREEFVDVDGQKAALYVYENRYDRLKPEQKVESGNWEVK